MRRTVLLGTLIAALLAPFAIAHANSNVAVSVSTPEFGIRIGGPVYHPVPVYAPMPVFAPAPFYAPPPVFAPVPVYVSPPRVIHPAPVVVVRAPRVVVPAYRYYGAPAGVWVAPRHHANRHWKGRHHERRDHHRERGDHRSGYDF